jgi:hypothetical protein
VNRPVPEEEVREEELVPEDDAVIGRVFRWSLVVFVAVGAIVAGVVLWVGRKEAKPPSKPPAFSPPIPAEDALDAPRVAFTDVTEASGIRFRHVNGAYGEKLLPETMGSGCAFLDYDGDGDADLLFVNSTWWPGHVPEGKPLPTQALYRNDGKGRFEDVTKEAGLDVSFYGMGAAVGDYDGDGDPDLFFTAVGPTRLLRNDAGRFVDVTAEAGVGGSDADWTTAAGFFDADRDGDLDLFVCRYVRWSKEIDLAVDYRLVAASRAYGPPKNFEGAQPILYRNDGGGRFTDVSEKAGIHVTNPVTGVPVGKSLGLSFVDVGRDGLIDVLVANDTTRNFLYRNRGDLRFEEVGERAGIAYDPNGNARGAMGVDAGDYRNEGAIAFAIGNFATEMTALFLSQRDPWQFMDVANAEGVGGPSRQALSFGVLYLDYDLDGRLDLFQTNGHLEEEINLVQPSQHYRQASQLFWNQGPLARRAYAEVPKDRLGDLPRAVVGRAAAYADVDGDGDVDLVLTQNGDAPLLLRNDQALGRHWLRVRLVGEGMNRVAIGARIVLRAGGVTQVRDVMPTRSYLSQVETVATFGLGATALVDALQVTWPDGKVEEVPVPGVDRLLVVRRAK